MYGKHFSVLYFTTIVVSSIQQPMDGNITSIGDTEDEPWTKLNGTKMQGYSGFKTKQLNDSIKEKNYGVSESSKNIFTGLNETSTLFVKNETTNEVKLPRATFSDVHENGTIGYFSAFDDVMRRVKRSWSYNQKWKFSDFYNFVSPNILLMSYKGLLPEGWSNFCSVDIGLYPRNFTEKLIRINCIPDDNNHFDFLSYRNFTSSFNGSSLEFALEIKCKTLETRISLPWPMRANLLKYISVESCTIENYESEFYDDSIDLIPDTLHYIRLDSVKILGGLLDVSQQNNQMIKAAECGQTNAYMMIMRNITYIAKTISSLDSNSPATTTLKHFPIFSQSTKNMHRHLSLMKNTCDFNNLWLLDRSHCKSMGVQTALFVIYNSRFPKLEILNLSYTLMCQIPDKFKDWRLHFPALTYLDLSHNNISDFSSVKDYGSQWENPTIGTIDLKSNNITTISERSIEICLRRAKLFKVDIRNNPFNCKCEMKYFVDFMRLNKNLTAVNFINHEYFNYLTCSKPSSFKGRVIVELNNEDIGCELRQMKILKVPIIVLSVLITILMALVLFIIRYRKSITILAFTRLNIAIPCQHGSSDADKEFDAFIAYSQQDAEWVLKTLTHRLENTNTPYPIKICLHHRDFALGAPIADNIIKSVELSRHTVLVISKNFLKSEWCIMEFRTALQQSLLERTKHLIMVLLEDIPIQDVENDLKRCLQTFTYVKADDRWFWDKIIYAISDKNRRKKQHTVEIRIDRVKHPTKEHKVISERL